MRVDLDDIWPNGGNGDGYGYGAGNGDGCGYDSGNSSGDGYDIGIEYYAD
jgi:hypothetical protein